MDSRDRQAIEDLFEKIARVEDRSGPRDPEAEAFIRAQIAAQPTAAYYMAQTIIVQEQALIEAQRQMEELESQGQQRPSGGGFLDSIFGTGQSRASSRSASAQPTRRAAEASGPWGASRGTGRGMGMGMGGGMGGGGFLAGAAQTAMGVAGGVVLGNMLADMLTPDEAQAAGLDDNAGDNDPGGVDDQTGAGETDVADAGGDFGGGDFDVGDF